MRKLALIGLQGLGNSIINYPIYLGLKDHFDVTLFCTENGSASFYRQFTSASVVGVRGAGDIWKKSRKHQFDEAVTLFPNWRREWLASLSLRASQREFFRTTNWPSEFFLGRELSTDFLRHDLENNAEVLRARSLTLPTIDEVRASLGVSGARQNYVVVHPTASTVNKYYPRDVWQELLVHLRRRFARVHIIAGASSVEREFVEQIAAEPDVLHFGAGFSELAGLLGGCGLFIGLDSSMLHFAALLGTPVVGLWSFANVRRIYPYACRADIYISREVLSSRDFAYPDSPPAYLSRSKAIDLIQIVERSRPADQQFSDRRGNDIRLHLF